ncbi:MAG TPA: asparagine synthase-related protein [Terriglobales bacterium]|nr:asparagine synthase-related protein [Terriglobales bacterium]
MSAFGGILSFNKDRRFEASVVETFERCLPNTEKDGSCSCRFTSLGIVFRPFHTTPESHREQQPVVDGDYVFVFDGRIDNRDDLSRRLKLVDPTDVELFVSCYKAFGNECFLKLLGDFAAAVVDLESRSLTLARDPFGVKKLFYVLDVDKVMWSTDIAALLNCPRVEDTVDENFVAMSLAYLPEENTTAFKVIKPVLPAHYVVFKDNAVRHSKYWGISSCFRSGLGTQATLREELLSLLERSTAACLRSNAVVTAELSGGLDSSTIVCIANYLSQINSSVQSLRTLSIVYDKARQSDERQFISVVEKYLGRPGMHIKEDDDPILSRWPDPWFVSYPNRVLCFGGAVDRVHDAMESIGSRVLLSGDFGDQLFVSSYKQPYDAVDQIREGRYRDAYRTCRNWSFRNRHPLLQTIWHAAIRPNLPYAMRRMQTHSVYGPRVSTASFRIPAWLDAEFVRRTALKERIHRVVERDAFLKAGSAGIRFANVMEAVGWFSSGYSQNRTTKRCIEMRYPYLYRPLVEFLIAIPYRALCNEQSARALQRATIEGIVPEQIRTRTDKRGPAEAILMAARRGQKTLLSLIENSRAWKRGFVNRAELIREAQRWSIGQSTSDMLKFVAVEMWLRALELRRDPNADVDRILPPGWQRPQHVGS